MNETPAPLDWLHRRKLALALLVIAALAFALRWDGADWGLPFRLHPDEWKYVYAGGQVHHGVWNPKYFRNPPGFSYMNAAWYTLWMYITPDVTIPDWMGIQQPATPIVNPYRALLARPYLLVYGGRTLSAILGALTAVGVYFLTRNAGGRRASLIAAALAAVSFIGVRDAHFATNDVAAACLTTWAMALGLRGLERSSPRLFYFAAALAGAATAVKYNAAVASLALCAAPWLEWLHRPTEEKPRFASTLTRGALAAGIGVIVFFIICPFPIIDSATFFSEMKRLAEASSRPWPGQDPSWTGWQLARSFVWSEGWIGAGLALFGAALMARKRIWTLFLFPLGYSILIATHPLYFVRFSLPNLPWVSLFAALGIDQAAKRAPKYSTWIAAGLALICAVEPLTKDFRANWLFHQTDTRVLCLQWFFEDARKPLLIASDQFALPLFYKTGVPPWGVPADPRQIIIDSLPSAQLNQMDQMNPPVGYVALSTFAAFPGLITDNYSQRRAALIEFAGGGEASRRFDPFGDEASPHAASAEDAYHPVTRLWRRSHPGPTIEVFPTRAAKE
ncbi:MAG: phospholipid carrier-dependent glycosyltransferase [bacterium]|nr:phospholipid carrier-dependent glycosyltransferase [bacterium]